MMDYRTLQNQMDYAQLSFDRQEPNACQYACCSICLVEVPESEIKDVDGTSMCEECFEEYCKENCQDYMEGYIAKNQDNFARWILEELDTGELYRIIFSYYFFEKQNTWKYKLKESIEWNKKTEQRFCLSQLDDFKDYVRHLV